MWEGFWSSTGNPAFLWGILACTLFREILYSASFLTGILTSAFFRTVSTLGMEGGRGRRATGGEGGGKKSLLRNFTR